MELHFEYQGQVDSQLKLAIGPEETLDVVFLFVLGHFEKDSIKVPGHGSNPPTQFPVSFVEVPRAPSPY